MQKFYKQQSGFGGPNSYIIMGFILLVIGVFGLTLIGTMGIFVGVGILIIFLGFWLKNNPLIQFHQDHLEMKLAPLAPRRLLLYSEIKKIDEESEKKVFLITENKRVLVPLLLFDRRERKSLLDELQNRTKAHP